MATFTIQGATQKGKHISVTKYKKHASGIEIEIKHNVPAVAGKKLRWVQTLSSNHPEIKKCKLRQVVDPFGSWDPKIHKVALPGVAGACKADDLKPFYWTDTEFTTSGPNLTDKPRSPPPGSGRHWWKFVTALAEVTGKTVHHLVVISWGYDRMADGTVRAAAARRATTAEVVAHGNTLKKMYGTYKFT